VSQSEAGGRRELVCVECGTTAPPGADGWRVYLTDDEPETAVYCPHCAQREFDS
jgi:DNA-directed RNA polymerase subunit RPC12/RpoP